MAIRLLFILALFLERPGVSAEFFVATNGSDANAGTRANPFATLECARDAVRQLRQDGKPTKSGVTIWLRGGDYLRTNALELTRADSGTPERPIVWRAYKNEPVRLLGGRTLTGFTPVAEAAVLVRLDERARGHVVQLNLRALGIRDFGEMKSRGFGRPTV